METAPLAALLSGWPRPLPATLTRFAIEVDVAPAQAGPEDRETVADAFAELDVLLKAGCFAWVRGAAPRDASIAVDWRDDGFTVHGAGGGLHHNLLVVVLRMIVSLHHTPAAARAELVAALGDDADALPPPTRWADALRAIRLTMLDPADPRTAAHDDPDAFMIDADIRLPRGFDPDGEGDRLVVTLPDGAVPARRAWSKLENAFLGVSNTGGFRSLTRLDESPGEAELWLRGTELVIDAYRDDRYALLELLNAIGGGRMEGMAVREAA